ncbi:MAG TPA: CoA ester lyase [Alphaproteobacteria bacterium]|jgi:malyl-CoA/(S)-citramalyl-CoA lyase|nr:CoA ester lyase [Alphaproteobacteria bacterium]
MQDPALRANRTQLIVPGIRPELVAKAVRSDADVIVLDLEDSVASGDKDTARKNVADALRSQDFGGKTVSVRVNALDDAAFESDLRVAIEAGAKRLDLVMVPKIDTVDDVRRIESTIEAIERERNIAPRVGIELLIESAKAMVNVDAIAGAGRRVEALHFGPGDYAASIGSRSTAIGGANPRYGVLTGRGGEERAYHWNDVFHYALSRIVVAARAHGLRPVDGPYADFKDDAGLKAAADRAAALGCEGKWVIHPGQIATVNAAFTPTRAEIDEARRIVAAMKAAGDAGRGAVSLDGRMIDIASIRQAEVMVKKWERVVPASA